MKIVVSSRAPMRPWLSRLMGFGMIPALALISPLLLLPLLTRVAGAEGWAAIATGQAIGSVGAVLVLFAWPTIGPPLVANKDWTEARGVYLTSALMRAVLLLLALPLVFLTVDLIVPPEWSSIASVVALGSCMTGLSASWFFVGRGTPKPLLLIETLPRIAGVVLSAIFLAVGLGVEAYATTTVIIEGAIALIASLKFARPVKPLAQHWGDVRAALHDQWGIAFSGLLSLGYTKASVAIVSASNFSAAPSFAAATRIQSFARLPMSPFVQSFQRWVYEQVDDLASFLPRARTATTAVAGVSWTIAILISVFLPHVSGFIFGGVIYLSQLQAILIAVAIAAIGISFPVASFYLVPLGRVRDLSRSLAGASIVGVPAIWGASSYWGADGALVVVAILEVGVAGYQVTGAVRTVRRLQGEARVPAQDAAATDVSVRGGQVDG